MTLALGRQSGARKVRERREYEQVSHLCKRDLYAAMPLHRTKRHPCYDTWNGDAYQEGDDHLDLETLKKVKPKSQK